MEFSGNFNEAERRTSDFKLQKPPEVTEIEPKRFDSVVKLESGVLTWTPEKGSERLVGKSVKVFELPERFKTIVEMFRQLSCSLRLLGLCKKASTFRNVRPQVEVLAKRKFSYKHLAQIKYVLPEAVELQKIIMHDEESQCMKPDLKITLAFDVVKDHREKSDFIALCHLFSSRIVDFICTHSEGCDIPEAVLPQPFSQEESASFDTVLQGTSVELNTSAGDNEPSKYSTLIESCIEQISDASQIVTHSSTPLKDTLSTAGSSRACDTPKMNLSSEVGNLMVITPAQLTPKKALSEIAESQVATSIKTLTMSEKPAKRALDFNFETADRYVLGNTVGKNEKFITSQQDTLQAEGSKECMIDTNKEDRDGGNSCTVSVPTNNEASTNMSCKMLSSLHGCIPVIHLIFRSVNYSPITKQELVFKILINSLDMEEKGVVEEHLQQLELRLPNWISKRTLTSGDHMYSIKKLPDVSALLAELQSLQ